MTPAELRSAAARVKLLALDVDGVLTDGCVYVGPGGEVMKRFSVRDGHGIALLRQMGVEVALVTREDSPIVTARASKLSIGTTLLAVDDKRAALTDLALQHRLGPEEIGFMGDDLFDLDVMSWAGFSACPADAEPSVVEAAGLVCRRPGGSGAVREVAAFIIAARGD